MVVVSSNDSQFAISIFIYPPPIVPKVRSGEVNLHASLSRISIFIYPPPSVPKVRSGIVKLYASISRISMFIFITYYRTLISQNPSQSRSTNGLYKDVVILMPSKSRTSIFIGINSLLVHQNSVTELSIHTFQVPEFLSSSSSPMIQCIHPDIP